jgi:hypothetical protein
MSSIMRRRNGLTASTELVEVMGGSGLEIGVLDTLDPQASLPARHLTPSSNDAVYLAQPSGATTAVGIARRLDNLRELRKNPHSSTGHPVIPGWQAGRHHCRVVLCSKGRANMPLYRIRVRSKTYLWGGSKIVEDLTGDVVPVFLTIRNDDFGDPISIVAEAHPLVGGPTTKKIGTLEGGQSYTLHLTGVSGVYAEQESKRPTLVTCEIHGR